jgi:paraquat-inducible protein A
MPDPITERATVTPGGLRHLQLLLTLAGFALLVPGVILPVYSLIITSRVEAQLFASPVDVTIYEVHRSILGAVRDLWRSGDWLVSILILFFSIAVPVFKSSALVASLYVSSEKLRSVLVRLVDLIGKWSMADVFVVALFLAFLATREQAQANSFKVPFLFQQVEVGLTSRLTSSLGPGFYYFLAHCLSSILWTQVLGSRRR